MGDTIFALSSGRGLAGIAVIRLSGPNVRQALRALCGEVPADRVAALRAIRRPGDGLMLDRGLCLFFARPRSFTGEDMGELHVHGGRAVVAGLLEALGRQVGLRPAEPGEFTKRAFVNGKLDLVEVEGLGDVIAAETEGQLRLAQRVAHGVLSERVERWQGELLAEIARVEALIDFADEADVAARAGRGGSTAAQAVLREIDAVLDDGGRGERLRDGVTVVIAGPPNAGKSTLLNVLVRREAAIVSPLAGTTRDPIEVQLDLRGIPVTLIDTAGLREAGEGVEAIGIARARERVARADLVLWLEAAGEPSQGTAGAPAAGKVLRLRTKLDLERERLAAGAPGVSAVTGEGVPELIERLAGEVEELAGAGENVLIGHARQRSALTECAFQLRGFVDMGDEGEAELRAEHLRLAMRALARLVGRVDVEEVLGEIFAGFCIGK
jgi:tRNA modification GTPase